MKRDVIDTASLTHGALIVTGTPLGGWLGIASALKASQQPDDEASVSVHGDPFIALESSTEPPGARYLIFVTPPAEALYECLAAGTPGDPLSWIAEWERGARRILRHGQQHAVRTLIVAASGARRSPDELKRVSFARLGVALELGEMPAADRVDAVVASVATALADASRNAARLWHELDAMCMPLDAEAGARGEWLDAADAATGLLSARLERALLEKRLESEVAQKIALLTELAASARMHERSEAVHREQEDGLRLQMANASSETDRLLARHAELEAHVRKLEVARQEGLQLACEHAKVRAEHAALTEELAAARRDRDGLDRALRAELHAAREQITTEMHAERERLTGQLLAARAAEVAARDDAKIVELQFNLASQELDRALADSCRARREADAHARGVPALEARESEIVLLRDAAPHRELSLALKGVARGGRTLDAMDLRLVEHHGNAGLVAFASRTGPTPFDRWCPNGDEDGRPFMRLMPADAATHPLLRSLSASDWLLLLGLVDHVGLEAARSDRPLDRWRIVARRLREELLGMPAVFRFDAVQVVARTPRRLEFTFDHVHEGTRTIDRLDVVWQPERSAGNVLTLSCGVEAAPLSYWPTAPDSGEPAAAFDLDFGADLDEQRRTWQCLTPQDRRCVLNLLAALPAIVRAAVDSGSGLGAVRGSLVAAAASMHRRALRAYGGGRLKRLVRALTLGRVSVA